MITAKYSLVCKQVLHDSDNPNSLSAIDIIQTFNPAQLPVKFRPCVFLIQLERDVNKDPEELKCDVRLRNQSEELVKQEINVVFGPDTSYTSLILHMPVIITKAGNLDFELVYNKKVIAQYRCSVIPVNQPASESIEKKKSILKPKRAKN